MGKETEARRHDALAKMPEEAWPEGAMGGTSDVEAPVDEAETSRAMNQKD